MLKEIAADIREVGCVGKRDTGERPAAAQKEVPNLRDLTQATEIDRNEARTTQQEMASDFRELQHDGYLDARESSAVFQKVVLYLCDFCQTTEIDSCEVTAVCEERDWNLPQANTSQVDVGDLWKLVDPEVVEIGHAACETLHGPIPELGTASETQSTQLVQAFARRLSEHACSALPNGVFKRSLQRKRSVEGRHCTSEHTPLL